MLESKIRRMYLFGWAMIFMLAGLVMASKFSQSINLIMEFITKS